MDTEMGLYQELLAETGFEDSPATRYAFELAWGGPGRTVVLVRHNFLRLGPLLLGEEASEGSFHQTTLPPWPYSR